MYAGLHKRPGPRSSGPVICFRGFDSVPIELVLVLGHRIGFDWVCTVGPHLSIKAQEQLIFESLVMDIRRANLHRFTYYSDISNSPPRYSFLNMSSQKQRKSPQAGYDSYRGWIQVEL